MRKVQKQQILEVIQSLHILHGKIKDILNGKDYDTVQTALADCQEAAIQIGEAIEQTEGTGTEAVSCLEQYCENLYQTSIQMREISAQKAYKTLESSLIKAQNAISHMEERREVVFLPYNATMWDSLESVWKAADEDPDCDAYVIPIPYYDKNPDGSFKEMHYEGDQYPKYVPVTNYEEYDFENRNPDVIFIHNPYDEFNFVTSVHPFFYAKNLKKFTQMLVYIPYFVLGEIAPDNEQAVKGIEHFCSVPGVFYADKVVVQSEDMRTIYINVLTKEFGAESRRTWENKILGLGSPKMDKAVNTKKEDIDIPDEWFKVIRKPDGSYKKIIFYNTSINGLLHHEDKMLAKMQDVFRIFKENKDEVALLWRPHPLIQSTISSMRPELWEEYKKIVDRYLGEGWGIYDDTADLNRAIALSDAYYGDASSVVRLFRASGKMTFIQKAEVIYSSWDENHIDLNFRGYVRRKDKLYFANVEFNGLFELSLDTYEITHLHTFLNTGLNRACAQMMDCQNRWIFFPNSEGQNKLCCYDCITGEETEIDFPVILKPSMQACFGFVWNNKGWFIPADISVGVYVMDLETLHIEKDEALSEVVKGYNIRRVRQDENNFSFTDKDKDEIVIVNMDTNVKTFFKLPIQDAYLHTINEKTAWITQSKTTDVYELDLETNEYTKYVLEDTELWDQSGVPYLNLIYIEELDCIFLTGEAVKSILKSNRATHTIETAFDFPEGFRYIDNRLSSYSYFGEIERVEDELWFYPVNGNMILVYSITENVVKGIKCSVPIQEIPQFYKQFECEMQGEACHEHGGYYSLQNMLKII